MDALGALSPIDIARAKLQESIADFLAARARLIQLMKSSSLQIQSQAQGLYTVQTTLEDQLYSQVMPKIQAIQAGTWSLSDVAFLGGFTKSIIDQTTNVNNLYRQAGGTLPTLVGMDTTTMIAGGAIVLLLGLMGGYFVSK